MKMAWEGTGQGDGGRDPEGGDRGAFDDRAVCLRAGEPSYFLYFWEMAERHDLLATTLQIFTPATRLAAGETPATRFVTNSRRGRSKRSREDDEAEEKRHREMMMHAASMATDMRNTRIALQGDQTMKKEKQFHKYLSKAVKLERKILMAPANLKQSYEEQLRLIRISMDRLHRELNEVASAAQAATRAAASARQQQTDDDSISLSSM